MSTFGVESPEPDDEPDREDDSTSHPESTPPSRIPPTDPTAHEAGKLFLVGTSGRPVSLVVTVRDGLIAKDYAPAELIAKLQTRIATLLKGFGGGFEPMFFGATSGASMKLYFGDPDPLDAQAQLAVEFTLAEAQRVAELIPLEGDDLFSRALLIGPAAAQYSELAHIVQSEGVTLIWYARNDEPRELRPDHARAQHARLSQPPRTVDRPQTVNGVLYRVITESTRDGYLGSVGLHLHSWSAKPPGSTSKRPRVIALYESPEVESQIKAGLVGESVEAGLVIRLPVPGSTFEPERFDLVLERIGSGPTEESALGEQVFDPDDDL